jgi:hypothetical protein
MFVKRRKFANLNNNELLENKNHPYSKITKICLQHKFNCDGNSKEVNGTQDDCKFYCLVLRRSLKILVEIKT